MLNMDFYDCMDKDRCVVPEKDLGSHYLCAVHYRQEGYVGKVKLSKKLFGSRWGFLSKEDMPDE